jgi:hypothetical protein
MAAYAELRELVDADHTPPGVKSACLSLSKYQPKLFCTVPEGCGAKDGAEPIDDPGALNGEVGAPSLRLEPSNFLHELLAALRAFEWPKVLVLIHGLAPPAGDEHSSENPNPPREVSVLGPVSVNYATGANSGE